MSGLAAAVPQRAYRIGRHSQDRPIHDTTGAAATPGRWNDYREGVIYASECYSTAVLETLVHLAGPEVPGSRHVATLSIHPDTSFEVFDPENHAGWDRDDLEVARAYGSVWYQEGRSAVLVVPSVIAPSDSNLVINANHPETGTCVRFPSIVPFQWDKRLQRLLDASGTAGMGSK